MIDIKISEREIQILDLISCGLTRNEIASKVHLSANTVSSHVKSLYKKLNVHNNTHLVMKGFQTGLLNIQN